MLSYMLQDMHPKLMEVAGKIRLTGGQTSEPLRFEAPVGDGPRWSLQPSDNPPASLASPEKVADITLFARYQLS
jgi:hypothetical protein